MPRVNWMLLIVVVAAVIGFGSSIELARAYGIAVTGTMMITTLLTFFVIRYRLAIHAAGVPAGDRLLPGRRLRVLHRRICSSSSEGGWFPLAMGVASLR